MKLLLTNDDGIDARGIHALYAAALELGDPLMIAPVGAQSGCSHRVTVDDPLRVELRDKRHWAVHGTPADCVRLGLTNLAKESVYILSGINQGGNMGADVYYSGTVAAVREAVLHGWPGIALSQYRAKGRECDWERSVKWIIPLLRDLLSRKWQPGTFWNINLPSLLPNDHDPDVVFCPLDPSPLPLSFRHGDDGYLYNGDYFTRPRKPGTDVDVCFNGNIAVTQLRLL
jgi:5'-nucleotidase